MKTEIKFYDEVQKRGVVASFEIEVDIFGWRHQLQGQIIDSLRDKRWVVVYPSRGYEYFPHSPMHSDIGIAEHIILSMYKNWKAKQ